MLKAAIIGCGGIAQTAHAGAYKKGRVEVVALCDIVPEKMDKMESILGIKARKYTDYKELIAKEKIDFVDVCTPNYLHADIAICAMKNGINAFTEKPDTISVERVLEMEKVQKETGKHLMVMRNNRYWYSSKVLKEMINKGEFGEIYTGRCGWIRKRGIPGRGGWFTTKAQSGGGPLIDLGVHMIDLAIYLMGNPKAVSVTGSIYNKFANKDEKQDSVHSNFGEKVEGGTFDVEDLAIGFIKFENGASLQIEFSWASNIEKETNFVELRGEEKGVTWADGIYTIYDGNKNSKFKDHLSRVKQLKNFRNCHVQNLLHFFDVLEGKAKADFTIDQGVNMIKILCAIYESARTGKEIAL